MRINRETPIPPPHEDFSRREDDVISPHDLIPDRPGLPSGQSQLTPLEQWAAFTASINYMGRKEGD